MDAVVAQQTELEHLWNHNYMDKGAMQERSRTTAAGPEMIQGKPVRR